MNGRLFLVGAVALCRAAVFAAGGLPPTDHHSDGPAPVARMPDAKPRTFSGIPSIAVSPSGKRLWATWYAGPSAGENSDNYAILATSTDDGATWKEVLYADPDGAGPLRTFDPEIWVSPDGKLRWTYTERFCKVLAKDCVSHIGDSATDRLMMVTLDAEGEPTGPCPPAREIAKGVMMCKPTFLKDGTWLLPVARWYAAPSACFYASTDGGATFSLRGGVTLPKELREFDEHRAVLRDDGSLLAFIRCKRDGAAESVSTDGGRTWSPAIPSKIGHPNARLFAMRLRNGHLLLIKHGKMGEQPTGPSNWLPRRELRAFISTDGGQSWKGGLLLDDREKVSYPDGCEMPDGSVVIVYDRARYKDQAIHLCRITEQDVLACRLVSPGSYRRHTISQAPSGGLLPINHRLDCQGAGGEAFVRSLPDAGYAGLVCNLPWWRGDFGKVNYLDDEANWDGYKNCLDAARKAGLDIWLYDELGYPSLTSGDRVLRGHPELESTGYLVSVAEVAGGSRAELRVPRGLFRRVVAYPLDAQGAFIRARGIDLGTSYRAGRVMPTPPEFEACTPYDAAGRPKDGFGGWRAKPWIGSFAWTAPAGNEKWIAFVITEDFVFEGTQAHRKGFKVKFRYPNALRPEATRRFLAVNHEEYARHLGNDLGKYFTATFTDEPHIMAAWWVERPDEVLPSAPELTAAYRAACGRDLLDDLPLLVRRGGESDAVRIDFWTTVADLYVRAFFRPVSDWCRAHGFLSGGHLMGEELFNFHVSHYGDFFRCMQALDVPSVDCLNATAAEMNFLTPLYGGSARELIDSRYAMCEVNDWTERHRNPPVLTDEVNLRGVFHRQQWGGINALTSYYNLSHLKPEAVRRLNADIAHVQGEFLAFGHSAAEIALYYPSRDMMAAYEPHGDTWVSAKLPIKTLENRFKAAVDSLYANGRNFLIVDDKAIASSVLEKDELVHGKLRFKALVMPVASHVPVAVQKKIDAFVKAGGFVLDPSSEPADTAKLLAKRLPPQIAPVAPTQTLRVAVRTDGAEKRYFVIQDAPTPWTGELRFREGYRQTVSLDAYGATVIIPEKICVTPQLILDSERLDYVSFPRKSLTHNSGWCRKWPGVERPFNHVSAGVVRYGAALALPTGITARVRFVDDRDRVLHEEKVVGGVTNVLRGTFEQSGTLAAVRIEPTGPFESKGVFAKPFRVTVGWAADEDFSYGTPAWNMKDAKVVDLPYLGCAAKGWKKGYDRPRTDPILEIAPGGFADPKTESRLLTNAYVFEFDALVTDATDLVAGGVRLRDLYKFTPNVWYHFRYEVADGKARVKLNGREIAKEVPASGLAIENRSKTAALLIDDVKAYAQVFPADYPAAPMRPKGEEKWEVLLNVCPLWHNGYHGGWQCIEEGYGPHPVLGYYDEGLPETADWEIKYMVEHGIDVQLFCWYPESHDGPIRQPRNEFHLRDGFKNARYSHAMKYALIWEIENAGRPHSLEAWKKNYVPYLIEHHFKDPRYYTVDGKVYLEVFGSWNFKDATSFGSASATKEAFAYLDGELKKIGFRGLYTVWCHGEQNSPEIAAHGFDAVAPYGYGYDGYKIEKQKTENLNRAKCPGAFAIPAVSVGFNSEPWHGKRYPMMTPADFETSLKWVRDAFIPSQPHKTDWEKRVIILSNWNEYGEGTYLMPTEDNRGFGYLDAIRTVFTDGKPDPQLNVRPTVAQRARICHLYPQRFTPDAGDDGIRYFSNAGDDNADGRTPQTAWRTIEKLNKDLPRGGTALFRRGDTFYGGIKMPPGYDSAHRTTLAAYGEGSKPVLSSAKIIRNDPSVWESQSHCFWRVDLKNPTNFTGIVTDDCNPGLLLVDGEPHGWKRFCHSDLVSPWDFSAKDGFLYVHATNNPARIAKDIRVSLKVYTVIFRSHAAISNVAVRLTGAHGMYGGWNPAQICEDVRISDCDFEWIGGSELPNFSPTFRIRFGNGVEFGSNARDAIVERCTFKGVYDTCFTMQGYPTVTGWQDIHVRNCTMTDSTQAFEIWCKGAPKGMGFERCSFTGNHTVRVGGGWGATVRPMRACATPLLIYGIETDTMDIDVSGNTFESAPRGLIYKSGGLDKIPKGYRIRDNVIRD